MAVRHRVSMIRNLGNAIRIATRPGSPAMAERVTAVPRMVRATLSGQYQGTSAVRLVGMAGAVLYILSPVDFMPEGLFAVFGLADDAMVLSWLAANLVTETEDFLTWERDVQAPTGPARSDGAPGPHSYGAPGTHPYGAPSATGSEPSPEASDAASSTVSGRLVD